MSHCRNGGRAVKAGRRSGLRYLMVFVLAFVLTSSGVAYAYLSTAGGGTYGLAQSGGLKVPQLSFAKDWKDSPSSRQDGTNGVSEDGGSPRNGTAATLSNGTAPSQATVPVTEGNLPDAGFTPNGGHDHSTLSVTLKWSPPSNPSGTTWNVEETGSPSGVGSCFGDPAPLPTCTVTGLDAGKTYHFALAYRLYDWTRSSNTVTVPCTARQVPNVQPESLSLTAQEAAETTTTATTTTFASAGDAVYLVFAAHTSTEGDSATLSMTAAQPALQTVTFIGTVEESTGSADTDAASHLWAWYARGTGNATESAVTATFAQPTNKTGPPPTHSPTGNVLMVMAASGVTRNPIASHVTTHSLTTSGSAVVSLSPGAGAQAVFLYADGGPSSTPPVWSPTSMTNVFGAYQDGSSSTGGFGADGASAPADASSAMACMAGYHDSACGQWALATGTPVLGMAIQLRPATPTNSGDMMPAVTAISPAVGSVLGGTAVTVTGTNFALTSDVRFGDIPAPHVTVTSTTSLVVTAPPGVPGPVDIRVTDDGGSSGQSAANLFTYVAPLPPTVTGIAPATGTIAGGTYTTTADPLGSVAPASPGATSSGSSGTATPG